MESGSEKAHFGGDAQRLLDSLASAPRFPRYPFLVEGLTFEQLYSQMEAVRVQIRRGIGNEMPLCLCTDDRSRVAAALLATLNEGSPLLLPYSFEAEILKEARDSIRFIYALAGEESELPEGVRRLPWPDNPAGSGSRCEHTTISWDSPWVYLFTGGSTGSPQIWSKTPRNLLTEAAYLAKTFNITGSDKILATIPPNHIYGLLYSILLPMVSGACVSAYTPSFPAEIIHRLGETEATVLVSIPAHYRALKKTPIKDHHVRIAFSSAGALDEQDCLEFYSTTGIPITEIYGSTETGGIARRCRVDGQTTLHPFDCVNIQIKNEHLWVRSIFLSDELEKSDEGFFETADKARGDQSGFVILGRSDGIVKVGGQRVDLSKIRETLMGVEGVSDSYVFAVPVPGGRENEIAALVEGRVTAERILQTVHLKLPPYARPRRVKIVNRMPLSSTGKYNYEAIKKLFMSGPDYTSSNRK